tara:strand:- start:88 stop:1080 length:993 start_codon:yes stop_codon:yes gene_type:complete
MVNINSFENKCDCIYKDEHYSVRDNGEVLRHPNENSRTRPTDNKWTFGKPNKRTGYLEIVSVRVHRIVATAFHGIPHSKQHIVDHIDTNKHNNRPDNLRWVTRLENILLNPITSRRIELICGSVEAFLEEPSKFQDKFQNQNYEWMCRVSKEEAKTSKERLMAWAKSKKPLQGGSLGDWIYNRNLPNEFDEPLIEKLEFVESITPNAVQKAKNWKTPSEFPLCPKKNTTNPIIRYCKNLRVSEVFSKNQFTSSIIEDFAMSKGKDILWIMCKSGERNPIKPYSLAEITYQNNVYVHESLGTFFEKVGVEKIFTLKQGHEWTGGELIDDYC